VHEKDRVNTAAHVAKLASDAEKMARLQSIGSVPPWRASSSPRLRDPRTIVLGMMPGGVNTEDTLGIGKGASLRERRHTGHRFRCLAVARRHRSDPGMTPARWLIVSRLNVLHRKQDGPHALTPVTLKKDLSVFGSIEANLYHARGGSITRPKNVMRTKMWALRLSF
jgi:hypothetical protein